MSEVIKSICPKGYKLVGDEPVALSQKEKEYKRSSTKEIMRIGYKNAEIFKRRMAGDAPKEIGGSK